MAFRFPEIPLDIFYAYSKFLPFIQASDIFYNCYLQTKRPNFKTETQFKCIILTLIFLQIKDSFRKKKFK